MSRVSLRFAVLALSALLPACATTGDEYPSLAIRDAERVSNSAQPVPAQTLPPASPPVGEAMGQRIARLLANARTAHDKFMAGSGSASRAVSAAGGARAPADAWINAQVALAGLHALRSSAVIAQADLDLLYAEERLANSEQITPTAQALSSARKQVDAWVEAQDSTITRLAGQISG